MAKAFKYRVCQVEMTRVTHVNGQWQGLQVPEVAGSETVFNSCPMVWEYLDAAGRDGWELVTSAGDSSTPREGVSVRFSLLFLKKEILS